eukprot:365468-Chlamydomonas_euryale.AAC.4
MHAAPPLPPPDGCAVLCHAVLLAVCASAMPCHMSCQAQIVIVHRRVRHAREARRGPAASLAGRERKLPPPHPLLAPIPTRRMACCAAPYRAVPCRVAPPGAAGVPLSMPHQAARRSRHELRVSLAPFGSRRCRLTRERRR